MHMEGDGGPWAGIVGMGPLWVLEVFWDWSACPRPRRATGVCSGAAATYSGSSVAQLVRQRPVGPRKGLACCWAVFRAPAVAVCLVLYSGAGETPRRFQSCQRFGSLGVGSPGPQV